MIIKQITISGFKSFGRKTSFRFDGGVTAIVGPNGSGKSNVADALRWVLGEQSLKALRVKKTEDLIFAGTGSKARGSVSEVSVLFDNSDGAVPMALSEIELSRKLYGSGESDYRLNGRKVRLSEVQELLAAARLGASSYAITSQGTIDSLILATPAERKLLFEEASGIRHFELQRATVLRQVRATEQNMQRARDVLAELTPRLATLERNVEVAHKRSDLTSEVDRLKQQLVAAERAQVQEAVTQYQRQIKELDGEIAVLDRAIQPLKQRQSEVESAAKQIQSRQRATLQNLNKLEAAREQLLNDSSVQQAELQHLEERLKQVSELEPQRKELEYRLRVAESEKSEVQISLDKATVQQKACQEERDELTNSVRKLQQRLVRQRKSMQDDDQHGYVAHAQTIADDLYIALQGEGADQGQMRSMAYRVRRLLKLATENNQGESLEQLRQFQAELGVAIKARETIDERYTQATLHLRNLELDLISAEKQLDLLQTESRNLQDQVDHTDEVRLNVQQREKVVAQLRDELAQSHQAIQDLRVQLGGSSDRSMDEAIGLARQIEQLITKRETKEQEMEQVQGELDHLIAQLESLPKRDLDTPESVDQLQRKLIQAEARLSTLQEMGQDVGQEYDQTKDRRDFLVTELEDLESAQINLQSITSQLDNAIQQQFGSAFAEISERFSALFQRLFEGGSARLILDSSTDELGIEIEVSPPGKRIRHLAALSGGERSLAGIALLGAIVQANPSPVLVLDEVDAALDEANAARCNTLFEELAANTQLILITHNPQTMVAADALFGVTMDHEHVSGLVSVQLDEAAALVGIAK